MKNIKTAGYSALRNYIFLMLFFILTLVPVRIIQASEVKDSYILTKSYAEFSREAKKLNEGVVGKLKYVAENGGDEDEYALLRLILRTKKGYTDFNTYNATVIKGPDRMYVLQFYSRESIKMAYEKLSKDEGLEYVIRDRIVYVEDIQETQAAAEGTGVSAAASSFKSWGVEKTNCNILADYLKKKNRNKKITVAVIDTGVDLDHSYLKGRVLKNGYDFVENDRVPDDRNLHGTHVAGIIVDCTKELGNIKILPVRVLDANGRGTTLNIINGINYSAKKKADIINLSLGGTRLFDSQEDKALKNVQKKGCICVVAAGNESRNTKYCCPAHITSCITVAAVDSNLRRAYFSNYGKAVDVAAPGVGIISSIPGNKYKSESGTSMAAPHVSGMIALLKLNYPNLKPSNVHKYMEKVCVNLGVAGRDNYYGYGFPDMSRAIPKYKVKPKSIKFTETEIKITKGSKKTLEVKFIPETTTETQLKWKSSDDSIATVSENGVVTGKKLGTVTITAVTVNKKKAKCTVRIVPKPIFPKSVTITGSSLTMDVGNVYQLSAAISPLSATETKLTWKSSNTSVASVDQTGLVTAKKKGYSVITVTTVNGCSDSISVKVNPLVVQPTKITLNAESKTLTVGSHFQMIAIVYPDNATNTFVTWSSDNTDVAEVSYSGYVTANKEGTALITAETSNGLKAGCYITVKDLTVYFDKTVYTIGVDETLQLKPVVVPEDADTGNFRYSSTNSRIAIVDSKTGLVTGVSEGEAKIRLSYGSYYAPGYIDIDIIVTAGGEVNTDDYIPVSSAADLANMSMSGKYILVNDIDLGAYNWVPIGRMSNPFKGVLDGNGYRISGISITDGVNSDGCTGLFGSVSGTIRNLSVSGEIIIPVANLNRVRIGGVAGYLENANLTNCHSSMNILILGEAGVETIQSVGGLCGDAEGSAITDCSFDGEIGITVYNGKNYGFEAGGIAGYAYHTDFSNCYSGGYVSSSGNIEDAQTGDGSLTDCRAVLYSGGISGISNYSKFNMCTNASTVYSGVIVPVSLNRSYFISYAGGITGLRQGTYNFTDCSNQGTVDALGSEGVTVRKGEIYPY